MTHGELISHERSPLKPLFCTAKYRETLLIPRRLQQEKCLYHINGLALRIRYNLLSLSELCGCKYNLILTVAVSDFTHVA